MEDFIKEYLDNRVKFLEENKQKNYSILTSNDLRLRKSSIFIDPMKNMQYLIIQMFSKKVHGC